jgi:hypothetical protein
MLQFCSCWSAKFKVTDLGKNIKLLIFVIGESNYIINYAQYVHIFPLILSHEFLGICRNCHFINLLVNEQ